jgi:hypothetical protein
MVVVCLTAAELVAVVAIAAVAIHIIKVRRVLCGADRSRHRRLRQAERAVPLKHAVQRAKRARVHQEASTTVCEVPRIVLAVVIVIAAAAAFRKGTRATMVLPR